MTELQAYETLCQYLLSKKGSSKDMPFGFDVLTFRVMQKMFALMAWQEEPISLSLKCDPAQAVMLCHTYPAIKPGYHLNKKHWITVTCDGSLDDALLADLIDQSYALVAAGLSKEQKSHLAQIED